MRIGFVVYGEVDQCTGGYIYDRYLINHLQDKGHDVRVLSLPGHSLARRISSNFSPSLVRRITGLDLDILIQDALCLPSLIGLNRVLSLCSGLPRVALVHQLVYLRQKNRGRQRYYAGLERAYLQSTDAIIVNSEKLRHAIRKDLGVIRPDLVASPGGDRLCSGWARDRVVRRVERPGPLKLFFLGNLLPNKGLHSLLLALKDLDPAIWRLSAAGSREMDRAYAGFIRRIMADLRLSPNVRLLGQLEGKELREEMERHHVLTLPYSIEGFGIAYLEGMSLGLPAVGSVQGAAGEVISHGRNGFLVDFSGGEDLRGYLSRLYHHREELKEMSMAALSSFRRFPTWKENMETIRLFVKECRKPGYRTL